MSNGVSYKQYGPHIWDVKEKKPLSEKQREALARGRLRNRLRQYQRYIAEAERRFIPTKKDTKFIGRIKFIKRLKDLSKNENISVAEAFRAEMRTLRYTTPADNYVTQIKKYVNTSELRQKLAIAKGTDYQHTSINWEEFQFDEHEFLSATYINGTVNLRLRQGTYSDDPNFVEITLA